LAMRMREGDGNKMVERMARAEGCSARPRRERSERAAASLPWADVQRLGDLRRMSRTECGGEDGGGYAVGVIPEELVPEGDEEDGEEEDKGGWSEGGTWWTPGMKSDVYSYTERLGGEIGPLGIR